MSRAIFQRGEGGAPGRVLATTLGGLTALALWALGPGAGDALACSNETHCADVSISGHAEPQPVRRGERTQLKITPKNDGPSPAYGIDVQVDVPRQLEIKEIEVFGGRSGCTVDGTFVRCDMGDFAPAQLGVIRIDVKATEKGTFISDARVYSQGIEDPNGGNGQVSMTIHVLGRNESGGGGGGDGDGGGDGGGGGVSCDEGSACADVSVKGFANPRPVFRGDRSELTITVRNNGPDATFGVEVQVRVPRRLKVKRAEAYGGRGGCNADGNFVSCEMGDFANQQEGVIRIKVKAKRRGRHVSKVRAYSQGVTDPRGGNDRKRIRLKVKGRR